MPVLIDATHLVCSARVGARSSRSVGRIIVRVAHFVARRIRKIGTIAGLGISVGGVGMMVVGIARI